MSTLATIVARVTRKLRDEGTPGLWTNEDLTENLNTIIDRLAIDVPMIRDASTTAIVQYAVTAGEPNVTISPRILRINVARLESDSGRELPRFTKDYLETYYPLWRTAANGNPLGYLPNEMGENIVRIYPPPDANDTLYLEVHRLPAADLVWATDQATEPGIPSKYHRLLDDGIMELCYVVPDTDTYNPSKAAFYGARWRASVEMIRRDRIKVVDVPRVAGGYPGFI